MPIPVITRVCANRTIKATRRAPAHVVCDNRTAFPTDGALAPVVIVGSNFSWSGRAASAAGPACRIYPYHGGSIHVHKGENSRRRDRHIGCTPLYLYHVFQQG